MDKSQHSIANLVATTFGSNIERTGIICTVPRVFKSQQWILDTGAIDHICSTLFVFQSYKRIRPVTVNLPNGSTIVSNFSGSVFFSKDFYLTDVPYIPDFSFNLISISKLTESLSCKLIFPHDACHI